LTDGARRAARAGRPKPNDKTNGEGEMALVSRGFAAIAVVALSLTHAAAAWAGQRAFVSSGGNDVANLAAGCPIAQPCRSFAAAISQATVGGEVIVLDSAGYGPVTITKSISIVAPPGIYAGISVFSGHGVTVGAAGIKVKLAGLTINGQGGADGIHFGQGDLLIVERCTVRNMSGYGIYAAGQRRATITETHVESNGLDGIYAATGAEVTVDRSVVVDHPYPYSGVNADVFADGFVTRVVVARSTFQRNGIGIQGRNSGGGGFVRLAARDNVILGETALDTGYGILADCNPNCPDPQLVIVEATGNSISSAYTGISTGYGTTVVASRNDVTQNVFGFTGHPFGKFISLKDNVLDQNATPVLGGILTSAYQ
jgi:hypothetical protein